MRVFVTGASGFVGSAVTKELLQAGHRVLGLARTDEAAEKLKQAGAEVHRGDIYDLDSMKKGTENCDAVSIAPSITTLASLKKTARPTARLLVHWQKHWRERIVH